MAFGKSARLLRDIKARKEVADSEVLRRAYVYVARNETLPAQVRYQAQLQLNNFSKYQRPTTVKNRCTETGKGRGVLSKWGLCRYQFRLKALAGEIPGVNKASW
ncbi:40S ribosomal protein mrp2, mitochondrial [Tulasnella sp. 403]|nr:40S ribosomal protein mrp2, mitochondrial [Tulasnella sp. 403]